MDGDGRLDLAAASAWGRVEVFLGRGDGRVDLVVAQSRTPGVLSTFHGRCLASP